jgi:hypothetical protein
MMVDGARRLGKDMTQTSNWAGAMREVGFVDVREKKLAWPLGGWAKGDKMRRLGEGCARNIGNGLENLCMAIFTRALGMSVGEIREFLVDVRKDIYSRDVHCFIPM